jgi:hypothetical protein
MTLPFKRDRLMRCLDTEDITKELEQQFAQVPGKEMWFFISESRHI